MGVCHVYLWVHKTKRSLTVFLFDVGSHQKFAYRLYDRFSRIDTFNFTTIKKNMQYQTYPGTHLSTNESPTNLQDLYILAIYTYCRLFYLQDTRISKYNWKNGALEAQIPIHVQVKLSKLAICSCMFQTQELIVNLVDVGWSTEEENGWNASPGGIVDEAHGASCYRNRGEGTVAMS